jgi:hypothetical protein
MDAERKRTEPLSPITEDVRRDLLELAPHEGSEQDDGALEAEDSGGTSFLDRFPAPLRSPR